MAHRDPKSHLAGRPSAFLLFSLDSKFRIILMLWPMIKRHLMNRSEIEALLKGKGLQPTLQRVGICQFVLCEADHPTAEVVHAWAEQHLGKISLATVYNTLKSLVEVELLREYKFSHSEK